VTDENIDAELLFKAADLLADARLRGVQDFSALERLRFWRATSQM